MKTVYMIGLSRLLKYPSQSMTLWTSGGRSRQPSAAQNGRTSATMKNGSQQQTKDPVMTARVRAALRSRFCSRRSFARCSCMTYTSQLHAKGQRWCIDLYIENSFKSYGASSAVWDHTVLQASALRLNLSQIDLTTADGWKTELI